MKLGLIVLILVLLSGCAELAATKQAIKHGGAALADDSLNQTIWKLCVASTIGSIKRKYGDSPAKAHALNVLCSEDSQQDFVSNQ